MYPHHYLVQDRHDELMRAAARSRLAAQARRTRARRRQHVTTAPARLLAVVRAHGIRPASS